MHLSPRLHNQDISFKWAPSKLLIEWRMPRLAKEQSEIGIVCAVYLFYRLRNGCTCDTSTSVIVPCRHTPNAADFDGLITPSRVADDDRRVANDRVRLIEHHHAFIRPRPNHIAPRKRSDYLGRPDGLEQGRGLLPSNIARLYLDAVNHSTAPWARTRCGSEQELFTQSGKAAHGAATDKGRSTAGVRRHLHDAGQISHHPHRLRQPQPGP
jgi:hypothetical protein